MKKTKIDARCVHPPLQGEGRRPEGRRGGVPPQAPTSRRDGPHPGLLRSPTLPLQGRVKKEHSVRSPFDDVVQRAVVWARLVRAPSFASSSDVIVLGNAKAFQSALAPSQGSSGRALF